MVIYIFGNPDLEFDSLPLRILPKLKKDFPNIRFEIKDPNEDWEIPSLLIIMDTVIGIERIEIFNDLGVFAQSPRVSVHDFDLGTYLRYLKKLDKLETIKIIGVPPILSELEALNQLNMIFNSNLL